jgi:HEAT repeat protein
MSIESILADKSAKPKEKTAALSGALVDGTISVDELVAFARGAKDAARATCIEAAEHASGTRPEIATTELFDFVTDSLAAKAPRVRWESARVIGNTARLFPRRLAPAIESLLANTEDPGTVVRWSAAFALGEIAKLKTAHNRDLVPALQAIADREERESIRKIYLAALRKV